jgi:hypothetical protein
MHDVNISAYYSCTDSSMLKHVSKHPPVAAERNRASLGVVWLIGRLVSTDVNVTGRAGADTIYNENPI